MRLIGHSSKKILKKAVGDRQVCYQSIMRMIQDRTVLTVVRHDGAWAVEHDGQMFGRSLDKEVAKAAANKRARQLQDEGQACRVAVNGELGFHGAS